MVRFLHAVFALVAASLVPCAADSPAPASPAKVVQALYQVSLDKSAGFDAASVARVKQYLSPDLYALIQKKLNQPTPPGDAPDIDGDLFLDAQDLPTSFLVGDTTFDGDKAQVLITLKWSDEKRRYHVILQKIDGAWLVTDVNYGQDGTLRNLLK